MMVVNTDYVPGVEVERVLGIVWGSSVKAKHVGKDIKMAFKHLIGGELTDYADMLEEARKMAFKRMIEKAKALGADAVVNVRFTTSNIMSGAAEMVAYGTAVKLKKQ
ncbi:MAG: YbjQ family protein [Candidatus Methanomethylicia archaeon]